MLDKIIELDDADLEMIFERYFNIIALVATSFAKKSKKFVKIVRKHQTVIMKLVVAIESVISLISGKEITKFLTSIKKESDIIYDDIVNSSEMKEFEEKINFILY